MSNIQAGPPRGQSFSADAQAMMRFDAMKKSATTGYILWFLLGIFSAHKFYLGKPGQAIAQLILFWLGAALAVALIGVPMMIAALIWWFVDVFLIAGTVERYNLDLMHRI